MGKLKEFLICKGCSEFLIEHISGLNYWYEGDIVVYKCPYCGTINKSEPLEEG